MYRTCKSKKWKSAFIGRATLLVLLVRTISGSTTYAEEAKQPAVKPASTNPTNLTTKPTLTVAGMSVFQNLSYGPAGERNLLDIYVPEKATGKLPLIVWIHGGGWQAGNKEGCPAVSTFPHQYVFASINYRFSQTDVFPAQMHDC